MSVEAHAGRNRIVILGATGSIGTSALDIVRHNLDELEIVGLAGRRNIDRLEEQAREFRPPAVAVYDRDAARALQERLSELKIEVWSGPEGQERMGRLAEADVVLTAVEGVAGLIPTLSAVEAGKVVALANKEPLVAAGELVVGRAAERGAQLLPVDSEHNAIYQALKGHRPEDVRRLILTASGGPFRDHSKEEMGTVTREEALSHPNWDMGPKVTIDSATMMNKGLEIIEARWLFGVPRDRIEVLVHRESIVHSLVEYVDGSFIGQLGLPDMRIPISYALRYPKRLEAHFPPLDLAEVGRLSFSAPDPDRFPSLSLAREALRVGETMPAVMNAANEMAVEYFLQGLIPFIRIPELIERVMEAHRPERNVELETIQRADGWAREEARAWLARWNGAGRS
ncbi:MAG: 1-deoxy-D-xylulose-5-phosphate reductoisomerase [Nitrospinota bacterium]|jgi:1-deoxy-D-xylulose-5-phosphate reductoisomerase|nr:1-deoxy-D-xylulose-5-phosphate reductoisomerase [Nitrospinota bacterium]